MVSPVQTSILPSWSRSKLVHRNDFVLEKLQQVVVQLELDLECAIGNTA